MEDIQEEMQELLSLIRSKSKPSYIKEELENYHDSDIAEVICYLTEEERKKLYRILGKERVSNVFTYLENVEDYMKLDGKSKKKKKFQIGNDYYVHDEAYGIYRCHNWNDIVKTIDDISKYNN